VKFRDYIEESFNTDVSIDIVFQKHKMHRYKFNVGDDYVFEALKMIDGWEIAFSNLTVDIVKGVGILGSKSFMKVFSAVVKCFDMFVKKEKPRTIIFTAYEPSRIKLYDRFAKHIENRYNYKQVLQKYLSYKTYRFERIEN
jgi:hypothetical protein